MRETDILREATDYVRDIFKEDHTGHDFFHTMRVCKMARRIAEEEKADLFLVSLAALLHDVDDRKLSPETWEKKEKAVAFMRSQEVSESTIHAVCTILEEVSFAGTDSVVPSSMEGKCVQDADRIDALGAIGIARAFAYGGSHNRAIHDPGIKPKDNMGKEEYHKHISTTVNHFQEKLFCLKEQMHTKTGMEMAGHREQYMKDYLDEFMKEWDGIL